ncbi:hypothetical protein NEF87_000989 [Candidatus Lokiarchaeum ossiferum]|uniref:Uncharacterized protein n=1 Tax=Candidatus Lokiarchaeum ossiferum TaxID=2951803 RepID=A0ABY6HQ53_9ARCH|nr:hypothetical protein NEF87_000989 [Candidatus Lokiarchaeum sp. B-35]
MWMCLNHTVWNEAKILIELKQSLIQEVMIKEKNHGILVFFIYESFTIWYSPTKKIFYYS